jgi:hypothetical protein
MVAAKIANMKQGRPSQKLPSGPFNGEAPRISQAQAAALMGVSTRSAKRATST